MSAPTTPTSSHTYPSSPAHPTRPFSPSPPRDNTYSSSRPPSLFLGASLPIASTSQPDFHAFDLSVPGIQESYDGIPRSGEMSHEMFGLGGMRVRKESRVGSIGEVDRTSVTGELDIPRDSLSMLRSRSSDSVSSASSTSPPLGSTSILAALSATSSPSSSRRQSRLSTGHSTPPHSALPSTPRSPQSAKSPRVSLSHPSTIPNSRSMPRLHQPTVVRSTSGRGVAFLPPPSQPVALDSTSLGRSRTSRLSLPGQMGPMYTSDLDEGGRESRYHSFREGLRPRPATYMSDLGPPVRLPSSASTSHIMPGRADEFVMDDAQARDAIVLTKGVEADLYAKNDFDIGGPSRSKVLQSDPAPMPHSRMDESQPHRDTADTIEVADQPEVMELEFGDPSIDSVLEVEVAEHTIDRTMNISQNESPREKGAVHLEKALEGELVEPVAGPPTPQAGSAAEIDYHDDRHDQMLAEEITEISPRLSNLAVKSESSPDHTNQFLESKQATMGSVEHLISHDLTRSHEGDTENLGPSQARLGVPQTLSNGKQALAIPVSHDEPILNEITDRDQKTDGTSLDEPLQCSIDDDKNSSDLVVYVPPYKPRQPSSNGVYQINRLGTQSQDDVFSLTLLAAISRQSRSDPLTFTSPHLELYLSWAEPRSWTWLPARKYIPAKLEVRLVSSGLEVILPGPEFNARQQEAERRRGMGRNLVRAVVGRLPVVWRFAGWL